MADPRIEWNADDVLKKISSVTENVSKIVAKKIMSDAKKILKQKAKKTSERGLLTQFSIEKSRFKDGGYLVWCQGPKNWTPPYHASFLEMGTFKDDAKPFMRPAKKRNERKANKMYKDELSKI